MVKKLWETLHIPVFALVDADPHGMHLCIRYRSYFISNEHAVLSAVGVLSAVQYEKVFNDYELH